ncbi:MAG TPA: hypothetical protein VK558_01515 [Patescibacteria group bacterium]|nr:hypothetical protein [Patescibacteria group bacterium]
MALWPEFIDSSLTLRPVLHIEVLAADEANLSYELRTVGVARQIVDGNIFWNEELPPEFERRGSVAPKATIWFSGMDEVKSTTCTV